MQKRWQEAKEHIESKPESIYSFIEGTNSRRPVVHVLCKLAKFVDSSPETSGELSDDEDEEAAIEEVRTAECLECMKDDNKKICELTKYIINLSHILGPVKVPLPPSEDDAASEESGEERFEVHESILTVKDSFEKTPLHVLCENSADIGVMRVILESVRESSQNTCAPAALSLICAKDSRGSTPLHYLAYSRVCPFSSLELLMHYCKPSFDESSGVYMDPTICTDVDGETPLHWALDGYISPRRIEQLIRHSKVALRVKNSAGRRPFDQFVSNFVDSDWKLHEVCARELWGSVQAYLKLVRNEEEKKEEEWLPVHMLGGSSLDFPSVFSEIALHYNKEDLSKPNSKGLLPLHLACARGSSNTVTPCDDTLASKMLDLYPQAVYKPSDNAEKRLPIHMAVNSRKPLPLIAELLRAYPNSLNVPDPTTGLWPFLLAGAVNGNSLETSYALLRAEPSIVQIAIKTLISKSGERAAQALSDDLEEHSSRRLKTLALEDDFFD